MAAQSEPRVCGAVAGSIWGTPGDDVALYCSAGPDQGLTAVNNSKNSTAKKTSITRGAASRIWMIRF